MDFQLVFCSATDQKFKDIKWTTLAFPKNAVARNLGGLNGANSATPHPTPMTADLNRHVLFMLLL